MIDMRRAEGATLGQLLTTRLDEIARHLPTGRRARPGASRRHQVPAGRTGSGLLSASERFDSDRLHQEAILLAAKADIREELDRLSSHVSRRKSFSSMVAQSAAKLDFLAQELHRELNTLTAKANDVELTNIGLELKSVVEQFREQVQNLE